MMTMKTKSIRYSSKRIFAKKKLKNELIKQILKIENENTPNRGKRNRRIHKES